jgi:hypothetical protein
VATQRSRGERYGAQSLGEVQRDAYPYHSAGPRTRS